MILLNSDDSGPRSFADGSGTASRDVDRRAAQRANFVEEHEPDSKAKFRLGDRVTVRGVSLVAGGENPPVDAVIIGVEDLIALQPMTENGRWLYRVRFASDRPCDSFGRELPEEDADYFGDALAALPLS
jgi:hypothetical protein